MKVLGLLCAVSVLMLPISESFAAQMCEPVEKCKQSRVSSEPIEREIPLFLTVSYRSVYQILARKEGILKQNFLTEGTLYRKGALLVTLENRALEVELLTQKSQMEQAHYALEKAEISVQHNQMAKIELNKARETYAIAKKQYDLLLETKGFLTIRAPFDAKTVRISPLLLKAPEQNLTKVPEGAFLAELTKEELPVIKGKISLGSALHTPNDCRVVVQEGSSTHSLQISKIIPMDASGHTYEFSLELPATMQKTHPLGSMIPGKFVQASRLAARAVPQKYILSELNTHFCLVLREGKVERVEVMLGEYDMHHIEIFGEISVGETVLSPNAL